MLQPCWRRNRMEMIKTLTTLVLVACAALSAAEAKKQEVPALPLLAAGEASQLDALDKQLTAKTEDRVKAAQVYQRAVIEEQGAAIQFQNQIRSFERMNCNLKEALSKTEKGWGCVKVEVQPPAPPAPANK